MPWSSRSFRSFFSSAAPMPPSLPVPHIYLIDIDQTLMASTAVDRPALSSRLTIFSPRVRRSWEAWGTPLDLARGDASNGDVYIGERRRKLSRLASRHIFCAQNQN